MDNTNQVQRKPQSDLFSWLLQKQN
jgi:hypothetical protein